MAAASFYQGTLKEMDSDFTYYEMDGHWEMSEYNYEILLTLKIDKMEQRVDAGRFDMARAMSFMS